MIAPATHDDARYVALLQRYDEELRRGALSASTRVDAGPEKTPPAAGNVLDCLHLLERVWPRAARSGVEAPVEQIGRFRIERILGHGGFGIVYLAVDPALRRRVALKVPRLHALSQPALVDRFRREARAAAALDHPHIVPVYESGEAADALYIASAYCPGPNLGQWLKEHPGGIAPRTAALIVAQLADAVAYSHSRGVLHRDIKPGNVLLDVGRISESGRVLDQCSGSDSHGFGNPFYTPRLSDFGLAKVLEEAAADGTLNVAAETVAGAMLGTPAYMAPEQAADGSQPIGPAADVYALGAVLYELLTGRPPFQGPNVVDLLDQVRTSDPVPLRRLRRDVPRDLETICLKCLMKSPGQRFATADALRDDLRRFLKGEPIVARPLGRLETTTRWIRRRPAIASLIATVFLSAVGVAALQTWHAARLELTNAQLQSALQQATDGKARAVASEHEARGIAYALDTQVAWRSLNDGDFYSFSQIIDRYRDDTPLAPYRGTEWHYLERFTRTEKQVILEQKAPIYDIVFGPDGRAALVGEDAVVRLVDVSTGSVTSTWPSGQIEVNSACFMPDGQTLWTAGDDGTIREWDVSSRRELRRVDAHQPAKVFKVKHAPKLNLLITCGTEGAIRLWDLEQGGAAAGVLEGHTDWVQDVVLLGEGMRALSASDDSTIRCWDLQTRTELWQSQPKGQRVLDVALSHDGQLFAECSDTLRIHHVGRQVPALELRMADRVRNACFDDTGNRLYVSDNLGVMHAFNLHRDQSGHVVEASKFGQWRAHDGPIYALRWSSAEQRVLTAGKDGRVSKWYGIGGAPQVKLRLGTVMHGMAFHPQGRWLVLGSKSGLTRYNYDDLREPALNLEPAGVWTAVALDPDGTTIAAGDGTGAVRTWDTEGRPLRTLREGTLADPTVWDSETEIHSLSFSRDGAGLAIAWRESYVLIVDPESGKELQRIEVGAADKANFSPVADLLVITNAERQVEVWDWRARRPVWKSEVFPHRPGAAVFSPDGRTLVADNGDRTVNVVDAQTGRTMRELGPHAAGVTRIAISPDSRTIATKDLMGRFYLWHAASGQLLFSFVTAEGAGAEEITFSPDGAWLAYRGEWNELNLLPLHP